MEYGLWKGRKGAWYSTDVALGAGEAGGEGAFGLT